MLVLEVMEKKTLTTLTPCLKQANAYTQYCHKPHLANSVNVTDFVN